MLTLFIFPNTTYFEITTRSAWFSGSSARFFGMRAGSFQPSSPRVFNHRLAPFFLSTQYFRMDASKNIKHQSVHACYLFYRIDEDDQRQSQTSSDVCMCVMMEMQYPWKHVWFCMTCGMSTLCVFIYIYIYIYIFDDIQKALSRTCGIQRCAPR